MRAVCIYKVSLDDAADAYVMPREILDEIGNQPIGIVLWLVENRRQSCQIDVVKIVDHGRDPSSVRFGCRRAAVEHLRVVSQAL
ncbi:hypothetical protein BEL01nite_63780 [Bradyrhizobium elkanii]|nr:hypothetical protein BEL01nite_63780 [Bradyrhizobium elkanii]